MTKKLLIACLCFGCLPLANASAQNIIFVTLNTDPNSPQDDVAALGVTEVPDRAYTDLLSDYAHVTRYMSHNDWGTAAFNPPSTNGNAVFNPPDNYGDFATELDWFNSADLIITSRAVNSPEYQDPVELEFWNTMVTAPVMMMSGYITRDIRLTLFDGGTMVDTTGEERLQTANPGHQIFNSPFPVALDGNNVMVDAFTPGLVDLGGTAGIQRGISINNNNPVGGEILASITSDGSVPDGPVIVEWEQGATVGSGQQLAGPRMYFTSGSREADGVPVPAAGGYDLTEAGTDLFLNAVNYLAPIIGEPIVLQANADPDTGVISILNGQDSAFTIDWIELTSANGNLDPDNWSPLGTGTDDGSDWEVFVETENELTQFFLEGDSTIQPGGSLSFGTAFDTSTAEGDRDIQLRYHVVGGSTSRFQDATYESIVVPGLTADFNGDGQVDGADELILQRNFGAAGQTDNNNGDANGDGTVDGDDQVEWNNQFGMVAAATPSSAAVPEPVSAALLVLAVAGGLAIRRRQAL